MPVARLRASTPMASEPGALAWGAPAGQVLTVVVAQIKSPTMPMPFGQTVKWLARTTSSGPRRADA
jgi:hypothetical protein